MNTTYKVTEDVYTQLADRLSSEMCGKGYWSGSIYLTDGDVTITFSCTLIIHYDAKAIDCEFYRRNIASDIVPVWYEFIAEEGIKSLETDFDFDELKHYMLW